MYVIYILNTIGLTLCIIHFDILSHVYGHHVIYRLLAYIPGVHNAASSCGDGQSSGSVSVSDCGGAPPVSMGSPFGGTLCHLWYHLI